jgi:transposase
MAQALSLDLRRRVVEAIVGGMTRRQAALRFGISPSSAIRWALLSGSSGDLRPQKQGGDRKSKRIEANAGFILNEVAREPDVTLAELQVRLADKRGEHFGIGTLWRFFDRRRITYKKRRRTRPNSSAAT